MTWEVYEYECEECGRPIRINHPPTADYCPHCGVKR